MRQLKKAAEGYTGFEAGARIIEAVLAHFGGEITVLDTTGAHELFRIGPKGRHKIQGLHVHEPYIQFETWDLRAASNAVGLQAEDRSYNFYVGKLLQALETGRYRKKSG